MNRPPPAPALVLDTNVVLDWLLFADAATARVADAVAAGRARWLSCEAMRQELVHMLGHASLARWPGDRDAALAMHDRFAVPLPSPAASPPTLRCRDADDQVFVDLALAHGARWLLTRDRALLALARRAAPLGLQIAPPSRWSPPGDDAA